MPSKLFDGKAHRLCLDQYGRPIWARTLAELREKSGGGRVAKQYSDKLDGRTVHSGYVIGGRWFSVYQPVEVDA